MPLINATGTRMDNQSDGSVTWLMRHSNPLFIAGLAVLLTTGVLFRSWGVLTGTLDFWADEAWWAVNLVEQPLFAPSIRPVAYLWLCKQLNYLGNPELFLRLPSYLAAVASLACICASSMLLFRSRVVILFIVFLAALHPGLIVYAKEFKPYSLEVFIHSGLTLWALLCWRRSRTSAAFWIAAAVALPFCYNIVFLYPALVLALAPHLLDWTKLPALRRYVTGNVDGRLVLALAVLAGLATLSTAGFFLNERKLFWGLKYGVFPVELGVLETLEWYARKTWLLLTQPAALHGFDPAVRGYLRIVFCVVYALGIASLVGRRRYVELGLLCSPLIFVALANVVGYWPYGDFRTNLFLIPGGLLVMGAGLDELLKQPKGRAAGYTGMLVALLVCLPFDTGYNRWKWMRDGAPSPQMTEVLDEVLLRLRTEESSVRNVIIADWHSWRTLDYYLHFHPKSSERYSSIREATELVRGPLNGLGLLESLIQQEHFRALRDGSATRLWVVVTKVEQFSGVRAAPLVMQYAVHEKTFATQDAAYHPQLFELRF